MYDTLPMRFVQSIRDLGRATNHLIQRHRPLLEPARERLALEILHVSPTLKNRRNLGGWSTPAGRAAHADPRRFFWVSSASRLR